MPEKKALTKKYAIQGGLCTVFAPSKNGAQSMAVVEQNGRFPEKGFSVNSLCTETIFVIDGEFEVIYSGKKFIIRKGDVFYLEPGNKYAISGCGENLVAVTPAWDNAQNSIID